MSKATLTPPAFGPTGAVILWVILGPGPGALGDGAATRR